MLTEIVLALGYNSIDKNRALTTVRLHIEHIESELLNAFT